MDILGVTASVEKNYRLALGFLLGSAREGRAPVVGEGDTRLVALSNCSVEGRWINKENDREMAIFLSHRSERTYKSTYKVVQYLGSRDSRVGKGDTQDPRVLSLELRDRRNRRLPSTHLLLACFRNHLWTLELPLQKENQIKPSNRSSTIIVYRKYISDSSSETSVTSSQTPLSAKTTSPPQKSLSAKTTSPTQRSLSAMKISPSQGSLSANKSLMPPTSLARAKRSLIPPGNSSSASLSQSPESNSTRLLINVSGPVRLFKNFSESTVTNPNTDESGMCLQCQTTPGSCCSTEASVGHPEDVKPNGTVQPTVPGDEPIIPTAEPTARGAQLTVRTSDPTWFKPTPTPNWATRSRRTHTHTVG
nr:zonadhesin-like [Cherax quadricarinatus]